MKTFRFFSEKQIDKNNTNKIVYKDWDFSNDKISCEFSHEYRNHIFKSLQPSDHSYAQMKYCLQNFHKLKTFTADNKVHISIDRDCTKEYHNTVAFINRGKKKTIISLGGGSWYKTLYMQAGLDHISAWLFDAAPKDYNVISFREQIERCYVNPVVYDSFFYKGFHDSYPSLLSMANYIKSVFPESDFYVVGDCKLGHSAALLTYYLSAKKCFLHSAVTTIKEEDLNQLFWRNKVGDYHIDLYHFISFEVLIRSLYFTNYIPQDLLRVQDIIDRMPNCQFCFYYHKEDTEFLTHTKFIKNRNNTRIVYTDDKRSTLKNHFILPFLKKHNIIINFFDS